MDKTLDRTVLNLYDYIFARPAAEHFNLLDAWWSLLRAGVHLIDDSPVSKRFNWQTVVR